MVQKNFAFIDGQNLYLSISRLHWKLDYTRFRTYLNDKYRVRKAYIFLGFLPQNRVLYDYLAAIGFVLIFKPIFRIGENIKGNCDAELVLQVMIDFEEYDRAVIITGDGDFYCLVNYLFLKSKLEKVLAPSINDCSFLLRKAAGNKIAFVNDLRPKFEYKKKRTP